MKFAIVIFLEPAPAGSATVHWWCQHKKGNRCKTSHIRYKGKPCGTSVHSGQYLISRTTQKLEDTQSRTARLTKLLPARLTKLQIGRAHV